MSGSQADTPQLSESAQRGTPLLPAAHNTAGPCTTQSLLQHAMRQRQPNTPGTAWRRRRLRVWVLGGGGPRGSGVAAGAAGRGVRLRALHGRCGRVLLRAPGRARRRPARQGPRPPAACPSRPCLQPATCARALMHGPHLRAPTWPWQSCLRNRRQRNCSVRCPCAHGSGARTPPGAPGAAGRAPTRARARRRGTARRSRRW